MGCVPSSPSKHSGKVERSHLIGQNTRLPLPHGRGDETEGALGLTDAFVEHVLAKTR